MGEAGNAAAIGAISTSAYDLFHGIARLALQLSYLKASESMGNHDSEIVDAGSVD